MFISGIHDPEIFKFPFKENCIVRPKFSMRKNNEKIIEKLNLSKILLIKYSISKQIKTQI